MLWRLAGVRGFEQLVPGTGLFKGDKANPILKLMRSFVPIGHIYLE
jgi:hypothetical protein